jgi:two-component system OmpR family response regulator
VSKILVADDEPELLELLRFSLDAAGHEVTAVPDGRQALDKGQAGTFDLIILDVMMPHLDGYHVAREISNNPQSPPVLLLTSRDYGQDQAAIKGSGADAFLSKPFEITELLDVVKNLIAKG